MMGKLTIGILCALAVTFSAVDTANAAECSASSEFGSGCAAVSGGGVDVSGESGSGGGAGSGGGDGWVDPGAGLPCEGMAGCGVDRPLDFTVVAPPTVTIQDIARFVPGAGTAGMEPAGWMVVGLPANFFGSAERQVMAGTVLDIPAEVRFTPVSYTWDFGDGQSLESSSPGSSWASLGLPEFSATSTSHTFGEPGAFTIRLTVNFSAEYRFGADSFIPLVGSVPSSTNEIVALAGSAQTVLVGEQCTDSRRGLGC
jgi:hypothetical protein